MLQPQAINPILCFFLMLPVNQPNLTLPNLNATINYLPLRLADDEYPIDVVRGQLPDLAELGVSPTITWPPTVPASTNLSQQHTLAAGNFT